MLRLGLGIFIVLHGAVYLLYAGQSLQRFELQPGLLWPGRSWALVRPLGDGTTRRVVAISCVLMTLGFMLGGLGFLLGQAWWRPMVIGASVVASVLIVLAWDGRLRNLANQGAIGLLINLALLVVALVG